MERGNKNQKQITAEYQGVKVGWKHKFKKNLLIKVRIIDIGMECKINKDDLNH